MVTPAWLRQIEELEHVPEEQLQWWIDHSAHYEIEEDDFLFKGGEPLSGTFVIVKGRARIYINQVNSVRIIGNFEEKEVVGFLPFSRGRVPSATAQVATRMQIMNFPVEKMKELIVNHYELTEALVHVMTSRVRDFTTMQQQNEKMMALGKLSAGLAHELNNPASAIVRGSTSLLKHLKLVPETFKQVISIRMSEEQVDAVNNIMFGVLARSTKPALTMMERSNLEDDLADCLDNLGVKNHYEVAENFIEFGFTCQDVEDIAALVPKEYRSPVFNWINNNLVTEKMVNDIQESSQRIEKLVGAVKNFTHMDRDHGKEFSDIHSGIRNTLTMLGYKLKKGSIQLVEHYDTNLPPVKAFVGELNQVWTNLIDNAIDAMEVNNSGKLEVTTKREKDSVVVTIADNGPGIPDEIKTRIFDPFFTTKETGKGTGLGLDVVSRIVRQHGGTIKVDSEVGNTVFNVCFPINGV